jgi:hypothetical protein
MRQAWATLVSVWAIVAIVGFLAWTRQPAAVPQSQVAPTRIVVTGRNGASHVVVRQVAPPHATTQTSPAASGASAVATTAPVVASSAGVVQAG